MYVAGLCVLDLRRPSFIIFQQWAVPFLALKAMQVDNLRMCFIVLFFAILENCLFFALLDIDGQAYS